VNDVLLTPGQVQANHLQIPLSGAGARVLQLRWSYPAAAEPLQRPNLTSPRLQHVPNVPMLGKVIIPVNHEFEFWQQPAFSRGATVSAALHRADAMTRLSVLLAELGSSSRENELLLAQQGLYEQARLAENLLTRASRAEQEQHRNAVADLLRDNVQLAQKVGYETVRADAEKQVIRGQEKPDRPSVLPTSLPPQALWPFADDGLLLTWKTDGLMQPQALTLSPTSARHTRLATRATELLLVALVFVWILTNLSPTVGVLRQCWPEQLLFFAALGYYAFGLSLLGLVLAAVAVLARIVLLAARLQRLLQRSTSEPTSTPSTYNPTV
jgi:hypothetical protein